MKRASKGFLGTPFVAVAGIRDAAVVIIGASEASPYRFEKHSHSAKAPRVLRKVSQRIAGSLTQYDFDLGMALFPTAGDHRGIVDLGDVPTDPRDAERNRARIRQEVRRILSAGALPIVLGGDDSVPIPVIEAYDGFGPIVIVQIDAHVDWADVIAGNAFGYGSPMRRAAEHGWVTGMVQVGIRGLGSGQSWQHDDARGWGSHLITAYELREQGIDAALRHIPGGARIVFSIDCDGLDPAMFPAVNMPTPGGLRYEETVRLFRGIADKATIAGVILTEYVPEHDDKRRLSAQIAVRLVMALIAFAIGPAADRTRARPRRPAVGPDEQGQRADASNAGPVRSAMRHGG